MTNNIDFVKAETAYRAERVRNGIRVDAIRRSARRHRRAGQKHRLPEGGLHISLVEEEIMADLTRPATTWWTPTYRERKAS